MGEKIPSEVPAALYPPVQRRAYGVHGIQRRHSAEEFPVEEWNEVLNVNLNSVCIPLSGGGEDHAEKGYGKIIDIASMVSWFDGQTVPAYTAVKGGVTKLSNDWIARGINVNAIAPGYTATEIPALCPVT